ncbi:MAG: diguanylate cyclase [bacterium]|nr:diguanylate cyclase [bacterium]
MVSEAEQNAVVASSRLRMFLVAGVRLIGLILALVITKMHSSESAFNALPEALADMPIVITIAVIFYNILAGYLTASSRTASSMSMAVIALDFLVGLFLTYFYGPAYLMLSLALPVLTCGLFYGYNGAITFFVVGGLFYGAVLCFPFVKGMEDGKEAYLWYIVQLTAVEIGSTLLLLWLFVSALGEGRDRVDSEERLGREKDLLFKELQNAKSEVSQAMDELNQSEGKARTLQRTNVSLKEELETSLQRLNEARATIKNTEKLVEDQGREASQTARREKIQIQRQLGMIQQRLERQNRLVEVSRKLSGSLALSDTLLTLTEQLQAFLPCQSCVIFMLDDVQGQRQLFAEVAASPFTDVFRNFSLQIGEGAPGYAVSKLTSFKIDEGKLDMGNGVVLSTVVPQEMSALVAPLATPAQTIGCVYLGRAENRAFTEDELDLLVDFCEVASVSLGNSILYQRAVTHGLDDVLTGCHNGVFLEERMREELKRGNRYMYSVSLMLINLDGFAQINEVLGKDAGDYILRETVQVLRRFTRETDVLARLEADNFALLLDHSDRNTTMEAAKRVCEKISGCVFTVGNRKVRITCSIGVAGSPHDAANAEQLTMRADDALRQAKAAGGNQVSFWSGN